MATAPAKPKPKTYRIRDGAAFRVDGGKRLVAGQTIELAEDVAAMHRDKLEVVTAEAASQTSATPAAKA